MNDYLAERLRGLAYMSDDDWAQGTLREAADEIDRLNDVTDRMFQQIEQLISDIVDSREETRRFRALIDAWYTAETAVGMAVSGNQDEIWTYRAAWDALRKEVGR